MAGGHGAPSSVLIILSAIIFPPLGVFLVSGCGAALLISIVLTLLGWLPGVVYALYLYAHNGAYRVTSYSRRSYSAKLRVQANQSGDRTNRNGGQQKLSERTFRSTTKQPAPAPAPASATIETGTVQDRRYHARGAPLKSALKAWGNKPQQPVQAANLETNPTPVVPHKSARVSISSFKVKTSRNRAVSSAAAAAAAAAAIATTEHVTENSIEPNRPEHSVVKVSSPAEPSAMDEEIIASEVDASSAVQSKAELRREKSKEGRAGGFFGWRAATKKQVAQQSHEATLMPQTDGDDSRSGGKSPSGSAPGTPGQGKPVNPQISSIRASKGKSVTAELIES